MIRKFCRKRSVKLLRGIGWKCLTSLAGTKHRYNLFWGGVGLGLFIIDAVVQSSQRKLRERAGKGSYFIKSNLETIGKARGGWY